MSDENPHGWTYHFGLGTRAINAIQRNGLSFDDCRNAKQGTLRKTVMDIGRITENEIRDAVRDTADLNDFAFCTVCTDLGDLWIE